MVTFVKDLVSIISPCYNVEKYLPDFFLSLKAQTYPNIEIILVDDGSKDRTGQMLDEFAKQEKNVRVIHQLNGGVSVARNTGIKHAAGEFLYLVDPDDAFHPQTISILHDLIIKTNSDVSVCACKKVAENYRYRTSYKVLSFDRFKLYKNADGVLSKHLSDPCRSTWKHLFRHRLVRLIENYPNVFDVNCFSYDDSLFDARYFVLCHTSVVTKLRLYFWRQRKTSLSHSTFSKRDLTAYFLNDFLNSLDRNIYIESQNYIRASECLSSMTLIEKLSRSQHYETAIVKDIYKRYRKNVKYLFRCKLSPKSYRFGVMFTPPVMYYKIRKNIRKK